MVYLKSFCQRPLALLSICVLMALAIAAMTGCASLFEESRSEVIYDFEFDQNDQEWVGEFSDYSTDHDEELLNLTFEHRALPQNVNESGRGLFLGGTNVSDDLFMFVKRRIANLQPSTSYDVRYTIELASNAPRGCAGAGGAPGESVYLKGGASAEEPAAVLEGDDYRLNVDKGNQSQAGSNAVIIGTIENGVRECQGSPYQMITRHSQNEPVSATTDENGALWFFVGTDSGFEGRTELYIASIQIRLEISG